MPTAKKTLPCLTFTDESPALLPYSAKTVSITKTNKTDAKSWIEFIKTLKEGSQIFYPGETPKETGEKKGTRGLICEILEKSKTHITIQGIQRAVITETFANHKYCEISPQQEYFKDFRAGSTPQLKHYEGDEQFLKEKKLGTSPAALEKDVIKAEETGLLKTLKEFTRIWEKFTGLRHHNQKICLDKTSASYSTFDARITLRLIRFVEEIINTDKGVLEIYNAGKLADTLAGHLFSTNHQRNYMLLKHAWLRMELLNKNLSVVKDNFNDWPTVERKNYCLPNRVLAHKPVTNGKKEKHIVFICANCKQNFRKRLTYFPHGDFCPVCDSIIPSDVELIKNPDKTLEFSPTLKGLLINTRSKSRPCLTLLTNNWCNSPTISLVKRLMETTNDSPFEPKSSEYRLLFRLKTSLNKNPAVAEVEESTAEQYKRRKAYYLKAIGKIE